MEATFSFSYIVMDYSECGIQKQQLYHLGCWRSGQGSGDLLQLSLTWDTFCRFPSVGAVLRMRIDQGNEKLGLINVLKAGKWIKFHNLMCEVSAGMWVATMMSFTRVCHLLDDDDCVLKKQRTYDKRFSSLYGRSPLQCFSGPSDRTETDCPCVPFVILMDILSYSEEYFFSGYPPVDVMTKKRNKLLEIAESDEENGIDSRVVAMDPPWIQVLLKSYSVDG